MASNCGKSPATVLATFALIYRLVPASVAPTARQAQLVAFAAFAYSHAVAANGQPGQPAFYERDEAGRAALLQVVFADSARLHQATLNLHRAFTTAGANLLARDLLALQIAGFEDFQQRRPRVAQAVAILGQSLSTPDVVVAMSAQALRDAITTVGEGDAQLAVQRAMSASDHMNPEHFRHFLPMVSAGEELVERLQQLQRGAHPILPA